MYLVRSLDRYIGRHLKEYRSILDRVEVDISFEYRLMYRPIVHLMILIASFKISTVILSVVHLSTISYISVDCRSGLVRYSADILVDTRQSIGRYAIEYRSRIWSSGDRCIDRQSTHGVARHIDHDTVIYISVNYRLYIDRMSLKSRRYSMNILLT